jgi:hypothetical protein
MRNSGLRRSLTVLFMLCLASAPAVPGRAAGTDDEAKVLESFHAISSHPLLDYVRELTSEKYGGRLTGTPGYDASAAWVAGLLEKWGVKPAGDGGTWFQSFPNPYTLVLPDGEVSLHIPQKNSKDVIRKYYRYEDEFMPGGTSGSGEVTAEVVYVGYGITAPELGFDEYRPDGAGSPGFARSRRRPLQEMAPVLVPPVQARERRRPRRRGHAL